MFKKLLLIILWLTILIIIWSFFFLERYIADWNSMYPTIIENQWILVQKIAYWNIKRGDIITFKLPNNRYNDVKRVIGLPWEIIKIEWGKVEICLSESQCSILNEIYIETWIITQTFWKSEFKLKNWYFVMWDNRSNTIDSRFCFMLECLESNQYEVFKENILWKVIYIK